MRQILWIAAFGCGGFVFFGSSDIAGAIDHGKWSELPPVAIAAFVGVICMILAQIDWGKADRKLDVSGTALHDAVQSQSENNLRLAIERTQNIDARNTDGATALHLAALNWNIDAVDGLLAEGATKSVSTNNRASVLDYAFFGQDKRKDQEGLERIVTHLVEAGVPVDNANKNGVTALHSAAFIGSTRLLSLLLDRGAQIDALASGGLTPLGTAVIQEKEVAVELLLNRGARPNTKSEDGRLLVDIAKEKSVSDKIVSMLESAS